MCRLMQTLTVNPPIMLHTPALNIITLLTPQIALLFSQILIYFINFFCYFSTFKVAIDLFTSFPLKI